MIAGRCRSILRSCWRRAATTNTRFRLYARTGRRSRHNLNYWQFGDYLGIGAGAHGKLTRLDQGPVIVRTTRVKQPREYLSRACGFAGERASCGPERRFAVRVHAQWPATRSRASMSKRSSHAPACRSPCSEGTWRRHSEKDCSSGTGIDSGGATPEGQRFLNDLQELFPTRVGKIRS